MFGEHRGWKQAAETGMRGRGQEEEDHTLVMGNQRRVLDREQSHQT